MRQMRNAHKFLVEKPLRENTILLILSRREQGYTNPGRQVTRTTKFCAVAPNIFGSSVWNLLHVTILAPRILRWLLNFKKNICDSLYV